MGSLLRDVHYGLRMLLKKPGFTAIAVLALALGIGANSAIFSVVNAVLLRPLSFEDPDSLVWVTDKDTLSPADFLDYKAQNTVFEHMAAFIGWGVNLAGEGEPERVGGSLVSSEFFPVLGVPAAIGRTFIPEDGQPGASRPVVLSHGLWQRRFGADRNVVGMALTLNGESCTVVGVMPPAFMFPAKAELWGLARNRIPELPFRSGRNLLENRGLQYLNAIARLRPTVSLAEAQAEMDTIAGRLEQQYPQTNAGERIEIAPMQDHLVGDVRPALMVLLGAVGFVLLIACANVANLLLASATARQKEMAIRAALGASRLRIARQLLVESMLLALTGGAAGLLLALWGTDLLVAISPDTLPRASEIRPDAAVFAFTLAASLLTGLVFGLAPAMQASKPDLNETLKEGGRHSSGGGRGERMRNLLVVAEIALSLVLLIGAGLLIKSFLRLQWTDPGFNSEGVLTMRLSLSGSSYAEPDQQAAFYQQLLRRVETLPGVESAGAAEYVPIFSRGAFYTFSIEGRPDPVPGQGEQLDAGFHSVSPNYFRTMGTPFLAGRDFTDHDAATSAGVVIINDTMARRFWPGEVPLDKRISFGTNDKNQPAWIQIVGVVGDVRHVGLDEAPQPEAYVPYTQAPYRFMTVVVRTATDPSGLISALRSEVRTLDPRQPVYDIKTMKEVVSKSVAGRRLNMLLLGVFAAVALALAAVGIYGVMSYSVTQRTHEIGIRMALGARRSDVLRLVVKQGMKVVAIGVAIGVAAALVLTRLLTSLLYSVSATDPVTFTLLALALAAVALIASLVPALKATRVDPLVALRYE